MSYFLLNCQGGRTSHCRPNFPDAQLFSTDLLILLSCPHVQARTSRLWPCSRPRGPWRTSPTTKKVSVSTHFANDTFRVCILKVHTGRQSQQISSSGSLSYRKVWCLWEEVGPHMKEIPHCSNAVLHWDSLPNNNDNSHNIINKLKFKK